ncbi:MAG: hypothetical protein KME40_25290 [Komarekiella atlantica HA4396-MV6]|jgi:hypothetical protein|nr:hypothetical protein [Komarekiella atlantica HA4396-MV6]
MHIYLSDDDISQMPESLLHPVLDWLKTKNSPFDAGITKGGMAVRVKLKRKEVRKRGCNYINSPKVSCNDWKCERWNLSGWSVTRPR